MIYYTGIGSRKIPEDIKRKFVTYGAALAELGFTLRSGAAHGADAAFEEGCDSVDGKKEIYLPWKKFNKHKSELFYISPEALEIAEEFYGPRWKFVKTFTHKFMARNMYQVTGMNLDEPSKFVVCWTPDGCSTREERTNKTGGTGQAITYASELGVPVFNLKNEDAEAHLFNYIGKLLGE